VNLAVVTLGVCGELHEDEGKVGGVQLHPPVGYHGGESASVPRAKVWSRPASHCGCGGCGLRVEGLGLKVEG